MSDINQVKDLDRKYIRKMLVTDGLICRRKSAGKTELLTFIWEHHSKYLEEFLMKQVHNTKFL